MGLLLEIFDRKKDVRKATDPAPAVQLNGAMVNPKEIIPGEKIDPINAPYTPMDGIVFVAIQAEQADLTNKFNEKRAAEEAITVRRGRITHNEEDVAPKVSKTRTSILLTKRS
jgi:hypothetical protein